MDRVVGLRIPIRCAFSFVLTGIYALITQPSVRSKHTSMAQNSTRLSLWISQDSTFLMDNGQSFNGKDCPCCEMVGSLGYSFGSTVSFFCRTDEGQASLIKAFEGGKGLEKDRCAVTRDLHIKSVDNL